MANITFAEFLTIVFGSAIPEQAADNLIAPHRKYVIDGLIDLQLKVPCLAVAHTDYITQAETMYYCGATLFDAPRGRISSLSTILISEPCDRVFYDPRPKAEIDCRIRSEVSCDDLVHPYGMYDNGYGYVDYPDLSGTTPGLEYPDCTLNKTCRASSGIFANHKGQIWMYPHIDCTEKIVMEWDGVKRTWADSDLIDDDPETQQAIELYLREKIALFEDCDRERYLAFKLEYVDKVAELIWECNQEKRLVEREACLSES